jgi:hypothetical protein
MNQSKRSMSFLRMPFGCRAGGENARSIDH